MKQFRAHGGALQQPVTINVSNKLSLISIDMIYLTAIGLPPGGSSTVHIYTQTIHKATQFTNSTQFTTFYSSEFRGPFRGPVQSVFFGAFCVH